MKKYIQKWKSKKLSSKISDFVFIALIVAMLVPASRKQILAFVNRIKSKIIQPKVDENAKITLSDEDYKWQLSDIDGNIINLSEFKDKVIFINFWATWCGPCVGEMPEIQKFYDKFKDNDDVVFLIVSNEEPEIIKEFIEKKSYTFPVYSARSQIPNKLSSRSIPTSFLISKTGGIVLTKKGAANWGGSKMEEAVKKLLK